MWLVNSSPSDSRIAATLGCAKMLDCASAGATAPNQRASSSPSWLRM